MAREILKINPIRLIKTGGYNYTSKIPNGDNVLLREDYQRGIYAVKNLYPVFDRNSDLNLQFFDDAGKTYTSLISNIETGESSSLNVVRIEDTDYINISASFDDSMINGLYRITIRDVINVFQSDIFLLTEWSIKKNLVKIEFSDSRNRNGGYFYKADGTKTWSPSAYYTGRIEATTPNINKTSYTDDPGDTVDLQVVTQRVSLLTLTDISNLYIDTIARQASCDSFIVNKIDYSASDFNVGSTSNSDLVNITMKLTQKDNSDFAN